MGKVKKNHNLEKKKFFKNVPWYISLFRWCTYCVKVSLKFIKNCGRRSKSKIRQKSKKYSLKKKFQSYQHQIWIWWLASYCAYSELYNNDLPLFRKTRRISPLKVASVIPLHKGGDESSMNNYRPVSILPVFSKIFYLYRNLI